MVICEECGAIIYKKVNFCGKCGKSLPESLFITDELQTELENKNKTQKKKRIIISIFSIAVVVTIILTSVYMCSYQRAVNRFMDAFIDLDKEGIYISYSSIMKDNLCTKISSLDEEYTDYDTPEEFIKDMIIQEFEYEYEDFFEDFDDALGISYKLQYKITDVEKLEYQEIENEKEILHNNFGEDCRVFSDAVIVTVEIIGKSKDNIYSDTVELYVIRDSLMWGVEYLY